MKRKITKSIVVLKVNPISTSCKSAAIQDNYGHSKVVLPSGHSASTRRCFHGLPSLFYFLSNNIIYDFFYRKHGGNVQSGCLLHINICILKTWDFPFCKFFPFCQPSNFCLLKRIILNSVQKELIQFFLFLLNL